MHFWSSQFPNHEREFFRHRSKYDLLPAYRKRGELDLNHFQYSLGNIKISFGEIIKTYDQYLPVPFVCVTTETHLQRHANFFHSRYIGIKREIIEEWMGRPPEFSSKDFPIRMFHSILEEHARNERNECLSDLISNKDHVPTSTCRRWHVI